jgi:hygromycin-B 4-O-kinase
MPGPDDGRAAEAMETAAWALERATHLKPLALTAEAAGLTNHVFCADTESGRFIVRLGAHDKLDVFEREREVIGRVGAIGVPVVEIVAVGQAADWPFMISRRVAGEPALNHPRRLDILAETGRLAGRIHTLRTKGYGSDFAWPDDGHPADGSWQAWLNGEFDAWGRLDRLYRNGLISDWQREALSRTLKTVEEWEDLPILNHGDLRLKNVLVDDSGAIQALIDWDNAVSSLGPHWDISIALHDLSIDAKEAFLKGYGLREAIVREAAPAWRLFNALNYVPTILALVGGDNQAELERLRTRLTGALDLYAF